MSSTKLSLRPHQEKCLSHAKERNTIVSLPTGEGKTLIATRLIEHYLTQYPNKRVIFLVPTRPLVQQQSRYCVDHCVVNGNAPLVQKVFGDEQAGWHQKEWNDAMGQYQIFLGIPAIFQRALVTEKFIQISNFSLIVFDECHNAIGNSPMASLLRDAISPQVMACEGSTAESSPRILGLTASVISGNLKNMEQKRSTLEKLMNASIFSPEFAPRLEADNYHHVQYSQDERSEKYKEEINEHVNSALTRTSRIKEVKRTALRCSHVFCELGTTSMFYYIGEVILKQLRNKATHLELQTNDKHCQRTALVLRECLPALQEDLKQLHVRLEQSSIARQVDLEQTPKVKRLFELLDTNFASNDDNVYRGIIFVEQIALVSALAKEINEKFSSRFTCGAVAGTKAQTEVDRQEQLEAFKDGQVQVLVATAALEEGIDVSECKFVIRFSEIKTTKGHIQGAGRARHAEAEIYYFENCPENERRKEAAVSEVTRDKSLALSKEELKKAQAGLRITIDQRHPYPFGNKSNVEGEVNVFNCKQLLVNYCARVLSEPITPEIDLYDYFEDTSDHSGKKLSSIRYPTPDGWQMKTCVDYMNFWSGVHLKTQVFYSDRVKNKTQSEREEMCFAYIVVVELREKDFLDKHNNPVNVRDFETKRKCPLRGQRPPSGFVLKDSVVQSKSLVDIGPILESEGNELKDMEVEEGDRFADPPSEIVVGRRPNSPEPSELSALHH
jgi:endoribonuclease Dicer